MDGLYQLALLLVVALVVYMLVCAGNRPCDRCRILCSCGGKDNGSNASEKNNEVETMLDNRLPPAYGPFNALSAAYAREIKNKEEPPAKPLGERLFDRGWVFITSDCQNCDPEDAVPQGPGSAVLGVEGAHVVNAENEPNFALAAGVQEPPGWFNMRTGQYIPNILPRDALEVLASLRSTS